MYFVQWFGNVRIATRNRREAREWLRLHAGVGWWDWMRGRYPDGFAMRYVA